MSQDMHGFAEATETAGPAATGYPRHVWDALCVHTPYQALLVESRKGSSQLEDALGRLRRASNILLLMQTHTREQEQNRSGVPDVDLRTLIEMLVELLAIGDSPIESYDALESTARAVLAEAIAKDKRQRAMLNAMTVAANLNSTFDELDAAAKVAWETAQADTAFEPDWVQFCNAIASRGAHIRLTQFGATAFLDVVTPERVPALRGQERAQRNTHRALDVARVIGESVPEISPRARRKRDAAVQNAARV
jgi:hypothetical protein